MIWIVRRTLTQPLKKLWGLQAALGQVFHTTIKFFLVYFAARITSPEDINRVVGLGVRPDPIDGRTHSDIDQQCQDAPKNQRAKIAKNHMPHIGQFRSPSCLEPGSHTDEQYRLIFFASRRLNEVCSIANSALPFDANIWREFANNFVAKAQAGIDAGQT